MKGSVEHKHYVSRYRKELKAMHFDCLYLFKLENCKKKYDRRAFKKFDYELSF